MNAISRPDLGHLRLSLLNNDYKPVPIWGPTAEVTSPGKQPAIRNWQNVCKTASPQSVSAWDFDYGMASNTGILCAGLRVVDVDIDTRPVAEEVYRVARKLLGKTIIRRRTGSSRFALLYRAAQGAPKKRQIAGLSGKVEVLGDGQQVVAYGIHHPSSASLTWPDGGPDSVRRDELPAVTEDQVSDFLDAVAPIIQSKREPRVSRDASGEHQTSAYGLTADTDLVIDAINEIPNEDSPDWEDYNRCLMAMWNATEPKGAAEEAARKWSERNPAHDDAVFRERWEHYRESPPTGVGAGFLFWQAREATGWTPRLPLTDEQIDETFALDPSSHDLDEDRYRLYTPAECADAPSRGYTIKGLIAPRDIGCIFGPPGAGKSLLAPFLGYMVALGREVFGRRVKQGKVLYVAAEDPHGMRGRVTALHDTYGDTRNFFLMGGVSNLLTKDSPDLTKLREVVEQLRPDLIVLDTVAAAFTGLKENEFDEMGRVVAVARTLTECGAAILLIHHDTKERGGTPRGHSILNGAIDVAICLDPKDDDGIIKGKLTKNRNGSSGTPIKFRIELVDRGVDEDGDPVRLPRALELAAGEDSGPALTRGERAALDALEDLVMRAGKAPVRNDQWKRTCEKRRLISDADKLELENQGVQPGCKIARQKRLGPDERHAIVAGPYAIERRRF